MPASLLPPPSLAVKPPELRRGLWRLHHQGLLSDQEHAFCTHLLECPPTKEWHDESTCWAFGLDDPGLESLRGRLRDQGLLGFQPGHEPFTTVYTFQVQAPAFALSAHEEPPAGEAAWIVFEQGRRAHLLRPDDLFAAERTLCGAAALDADWHPLPRLSCQPADYPFCRACRRRRTRCQVP